VPLKTLNPPKMFPLARVAAMARVRELQEVSASLLRDLEAAAEKSSKAPRPKAAAKRRSK
jgi:hypothetical protein